jgi:ABC-2 type transport system permease protein
MRATLLICGKDLKARLRDRSALLIGIVVPLGLAFIFNAIFGGIASSKAIALGVVNADRGAASARFVSGVLGAVGRSGLVAIQREPTVAGARALTAKGTLDAVIVIPAGFSARVAAERPAAMQVIGNPSDPISAEVARFIAQGYAADLNRARLSVATVVAAGGPAASPSRIRALAARAAARAAPVAVAVVSA